MIQNFIIQKVEEYGFNILSNVIMNLHVVWLKTIDMLNVELNNRYGLHNNIYFIFSSHKGLSWKNFQEFFETYKANNNFNVKMCIFNFLIH
jgi:hypothetical protein